MFSVVLGVAAAAAAAIVWFFGHQQPGAPCHCEEHERLERRQLGIAAGSCVVWQLLLGPNTMTVTAEFAHLDFGRAHTLLRRAELAAAIEQGPTQVRVSFRGQHKCM